MIKQTYKVRMSAWPNEDGEHKWTITYGAEEKGKFDTKEEAEENMTRIILNWRCDS